MALLRFIHRLVLLLAVSAFLPALADSTAAAAPSANGGGTSAASDDAVRAAFLYGYPYYEFLWLRDQAMHNAQALTYNPSPVVLAALIYLALLWPLVRLLSRLEHKPHPQ